ncbi:MAG: DUF5057 domain-containing protein [Coprococcus sp.]|nr:DUF5057 domain-containing protein [Coprococcus sp.]
MFKNKKVILSSIAIVFTLVVCSIFVNFTLANSGSPTESGIAGTGINSSITGYSNIDIAVINSNDASLKATGDDKFRVVQILPDGLSSVAATDTALTAKVTAANYSGKVTSESDWGNTSYLWRYIYGDEYFRLAVFNGYKTITTDEMAEGAVQLTSVTVSALNSMNTSAQEILGRADMIYIYSSNSSDYGASGADLSEELYSWLDVYATTDRHPIAICRKALCTDDPTTISGNNDTYRMGALAYKLITKNLMARYDNVLVTEEDFFKTLYEEAEDGKVIPDMPSTTKTISDFILTAERGANEGGKDYISYNTYYKWYDGMSIQDFLNRNITSETADSAYVKAGDKAGLTGDKKEWNFDNANVLIISEETTSAMFNTMSGMNSNAAFAASDYKYNKKTGKWEAVESAPNSELTKLMYNTGSTGDAKHVPSGANIYLLDSSKLMDAISSGSSFSNMKLSSSYYKDVETKSISGSIKVVPEMGADNAIDLEGWTVQLIAKDENGVYHYVSKDGSTGYSFTLSASDDKYYEHDDETDTSVYKYEFISLNANYEYSAVLVSPDGAYADYRIGRIDNDFVIDNASAADGTDTPEQPGYDYTSVNTADDFDNKIVSDPDAYSDDFLSEYMIFSVDDPSDVYNYVKSLHDKFASEQITYSQGFGPLDFTQYDFIFIDKGKYSTEIGQTAYDALCAAVEKGVYVIASSKAGDGKGSGTGGGGGSTTIIVNSPSAKAIADIINAGIYRDGSDNKFKVLEIQPDYPIDEEIASKLPSVSTEWETKSDGKTKITGNYYTVPSDVESGKAKEELPSLLTEYYAFDLTKAKIAYAIDGLNYGDIELTQVSTEALIGMKEDIAATYDLVYIGGDISALDRNPADMYGGQLQISSIFGYTYLGLPTFLMYYHTGLINKMQSAGTYKMDRSVTGKRLLASPYIGGTYYTDTYIAEAGNDLTKTKYDELVNYISSGRPVIVSNELSSVYENMQGTNASGNKLSKTELLQGFWYNNGKLERGNLYLDPSSRMYTLIGNIYSRYTGKNGSNVWWGFDPASTKMIDNTSEEYGKTNYTYYRKENKSYLDEDAQGHDWYNSGSDVDVIKKYAVVLSNEYNDTLNTLVNESRTRTRLLITSKPTKYVQGITGTYIKTNNLAFTFVVNGPDPTYKYELYVDKDKNTAFTSEDYNISGTVSSGVEKSASITVDQDFFGAASWYLVIKDAAGKTVVAEETGLSKIINNNMSKSEINVLQVQTMAEGQGATSWTATDTLYFDITSQTAHKIAKYNTYANQTNLDTVSAAQYKCLGRHENRFGIVEYDIGIANDDYFSNLADEIAEDYDINLDMVVASSDRAKFTTGDNVTDVYDCLDTWVAEAEILKEGNAVDGFTQAEYKALVGTALSSYSAKSAAVQGPKEALDKYLQGAIEALQGTYTGPNNYGARGTYNTFLGGFNGGVSNNTIIELLEYMIATGEYYMIYFPGYSSNTEIHFAEGKVDNTMYGKQFTDLFIAYRDAKDAELMAKDRYQACLRRSYGKDFMKKMYSILILGPSDSFGGFKVDFKQKTCEYILDYVSAGGDLFFFHDAMTPFADAGSVNLTKSLLEVVGMNRFHVNLTDNSKSYNVAMHGYTSSITQSGLVQGTLTEDGYIYKKQNAASTPAGYVKGTLTEDGEIYEVENYGTTHDWQGPLNGWVECVGTFPVLDDWGNVSNKRMYKKAATAGTSGYIWRDATTFDEYTIIHGNYTEKAYCSKEWAAAGTSGLIWQEGGTPNYNGAYTDVEFKSSDESLYYMTPYAFNTKAGSGIINSFNTNVNATNPSANKLGKDVTVYVSGLAMTALYYNGNQGGKSTALPYVYAQESFTQATAWSGAANADQSACSETVKAGRLNEGLITLYPYSIGESLNIAGTHQQTYALDLESDKITVWYTLSGSNNSSGAKTRSSKYAASPYDGMEGYFIYTTSYGSGAVTYCGAGHSSVTGKTTRNNDERKLFINVIVNSALAVPPKPSITVYEPTGSFKPEDELEKDEEAMADGATVYIKPVDNKTDTPEFDMKVSIPEDTKLSKVNIYFDLDYDDSSYKNRPSYIENDEHVMIKSYTKKDGKDIDEITKELKDMLRSGTDPKLKLQDSYFQAYGGNYTYIVIEVYYEGKTTPAYVMIKIKASDPLFDLTQNEEVIPALDALAEKKLNLA